MLGTLICFAREPVPGQVKTRLIPALGPEGATQLYRTLLGVALEAAAAMPGVHRELWCAGAPPNGGVCAELAGRYDLRLRHQPAGDLGQRMEAALTEALTHGERAVLIGSDCPEYAPAYLASAFAALSDCGCRPGSRRRRRLCADRAQAPGPRAVHRHPLGHGACPRPHPRRPARASAGPGPSCPPCGTWIEPKDLLDFPGLLAPSTPV